MSKCGEKGKVVLRSETVLFCLCQQCGVTQSAHPEMSHSPREADTVVLLENKEAEVGTQGRISKELCRSSLGVGVGPAHLAWAGPCCWEGRAWQGLDQITWQFLLPTRAPVGPTQDAQTPQSVPPVP